MLIQLSNGYHTQNSNYGSLTIIINDVMAEAENIPERTRIFSPNSVQLDIKHIYFLTETPSLIRFICRVNIKQFPGSMAQDYI